MSKIEGYRRHAEDCERRARSERSLRAKQQYLEMAQRWRDLAAHVRGDEKYKGRAAQLQASRPAEPSEEFP